MRGGGLWSSWRRRLREVCSSRFGRAARCRFGPGILGGDGTLPDGKRGLGLRFKDPTGAPTTLIDTDFGTRWECDEASLNFGVETKGGAHGGFAEIAVKGGRVIMKGSEMGSFLGSIVGDRDITANFSVGIAFSTLTGLSFTGSGGLEIDLPLHEDFGVIRIDGLHVALTTDGGSLALTIGANGAVQLGPVSVSVEQVGIAVNVKGGRGNLGPVDLGAGLQAAFGARDRRQRRSGVGRRIPDVRGQQVQRGAGAVCVRGGGEGVRDHRDEVPGRARGFSFIIIISAEFTPIQLGFGFTLNGVGGILGINRDLNEDALRDVVQRGSMGNVLFPKDPIKDAPSILHDIAQLFPAADGHFVFGPMAILAWGTPAIVEARLGIIIVFPGPRIALLGTVQVLLPPGTGKQAPEKRLVEIHLDIAGVLDFPKKHFALDAHLHDSNVVGFPISGDMAARIDWGANPNMVIAMGGFHPHFTPPAGFPKLRRLAIDLGIKGNPTATLSGYMAVTSNTAQIGAALDVTASAAGASLKGGLAFDAIFVFSPFSFDATLEGGVHVDFHGAGFGMHFHGEISGPAPWHLNGRRVRLDPVVGRVRRLRPHAGWREEARAAGRRRLGRVRRGAGSAERDRGAWELDGADAAERVPGGVAARDGREQRLARRPAGHREVRAEGAAVHAGDSEVRGAGPGEERRGEGDAEQGGDRRRRLGGRRSGEPGVRLLRAGAVPEAAGRAGAVEPVVPADAGGLLVHVEGPRRRASRRRRSSASRRSSSAIPARARSRTSPSTTTSCSR